MAETALQNFARHPHCPRCGAEASETYDLPCGCVEAFCHECSEAPRYVGWVVKTHAHHAGTRDGFGWSS